MNQNAGLRAKGSGFFGFYFDGLPIIKNIDLPEKSEALKAAMQVFIILFIPVHHRSSPSNSSQGFAAHDVPCRGPGNFHRLNRRG
jgi:hypothetical protein